MINKIKYLFKNNNVSYNNLILKIINFCGDNKYIVLCPQPTGYSWMGVNRATKVLFNDNNLLELEQYYSNTIYSENQLKDIVYNIKKAGFNQIILSGFPLYFERIINYADQFNIPVSLIYHGFLSELSNNEQGIKQFNTIIALCNQNKIEKIAFNKNNLSSFFKTLISSKSTTKIQQILLKTPENISHYPVKSINETNIGILINDNFRKNLHNQVAAAYQIENSKLHFSGNLTNEFEYYPDKSRFIYHKNNIQHEAFIEILGSMTINLHVTFSESWGQVVTESLATGTPCLTGDTNSIFEYNDFLKQLLVVKSTDDYTVIKRHIEMVIQHIDTDFSLQLKQYVSKINIIADEKLNFFINR